MTDRERKYPTRSGELQATQKPKAKLFNVTYTDDAAEKHSKILLIGVSGSGRSSFASTFPSPLWINADYGLRTPVIRAKHQPKIDLQMGTKERLPQQKTHAVLDEIFLCLRDKNTEALGLQKMPETIILDTGTAASFFMEKEICLWPRETKKGRDNDEFMELQDYGHVQRRLYNVLVNFGSLPLTFIAIFNPSLTQIDGMSGKFYVPSVTGEKFSPNVPHIFDEVYWFDVEDDKKENERYYFTRVKTKKFPFAKTKCKDMPEVVYNPTFDKIKNALYGEKL
jgi:hypothetical protein